MLNYKIHQGLKWVNPVLLLYKTKHAKRKFRKRGTSDPVQELDKYWKDPDKGLSEMYASSNIIVLCILFFMSIIRLGDIFIIKQLHIHFNAQLTISAILSLITNHLLLFRNKIYLDYFESFSKVNNKKRQTLVIVSTLILLFILFCIFLNIYLTINF